MSNRRYQFGTHGVGGVYVFASCIPNKNVTTNNGRSAVFLSLVFARSSLGNLCSLLYRYARTHTGSVDGAREKARRIKWPVKHAPSPKKKNLSNRYIYIYIGGCLLLRRTFTTKSLI